MSLWTPSGEHPVDRDRPSPPSQGPFGDAPTAAAGPDAGGQAPGGGPGDGYGDAVADVDALRRQLAEAPADVVVANHCYGLFELAAVYLSDSPPRIESARLAIDALGFVVDGLGDRLGEAHPALRDALAQIRLAFVQISATQEAAPGNGSDPSGT